MVGLSKDRWGELNSFVYERNHELPANVYIVDPAAIFYDQADCMVARSGEAYYFDDNHMSVDGARMVVGDISNYHALFSA